MLVKMLDLAWLTTSELQVRPCKSHLCLIYIIFFFSFTRVLLIAQLTLAGNFVYAVRKSFAISITVVKD